MFIALTLYTQATITPSFYLLILIEHLDGQYLQAGSVIQILTAHSHFNF